MPTSRPTRLSKAERLNNNDRHGTAEVHRSRPLLVVQHVPWEGPHLILDSFSGVSTVMRNTLDEPGGARCRSGDGPGRDLHGRADERQRVDTLPRSPRRSPGCSER